MDSQAPPGYPDIFGILSEKSLATIKAVKSEAVAELLPALSRTIKSVAVDMRTLVEYDPSVFFPAFERYIERQYDAYAEEVLPHSADARRYVFHLAGDVTDRISNQIRPEAGFVRKEGFGHGLAESARLALDAGLKTGWDDTIELSVSSGDWETYIERCFQRYLIKCAGPSRRPGDPEFEEEIGILGTCFRLRYKFWLRRFADWQSFDLHLRAHLSDRLAHWKAVADKRAVSEASADSCCRLEAERAGGANLVAITSPLTPRRLNATVTSERAARRLEAYLRKEGIGATDFANQCGTTDRTLREFRRTGKVRRDIFNAIAEAMGTTREALLKPD